MAEPAADPVVIELFASQNCTACPKAHRTLKSVEAEHGDVLILTWSVDYWDYLGDPDPMTIPQANTRQAAYTERMEIRAPYTPQSVYDGAEQCPATRRNQVEQNIVGRLSARPTSRPVITQTGSTISITGPAPQAPLDVILVQYLADGEHETEMTNPVVSSETLGQWSGDTQPIPFKCTVSCAVILQEHGVGEIKGARELSRDS